LKKILSGATVGALSLLVQLDHIKFQERNHCCERSYVVKLTAERENRKQLSQTYLSELYAREIHFYRNLQPLIPVPTPRIFGIWEDDTDFCLLMEDLTNRWKPFDGSFPAEHAKGVARQLAKFHLSADAVDLSFPLLNHPTAPSGDFQKYFVELPNYLPKFLETYEHHPFLVEHPGYSNWLCFWKDLANKNLPLIFDKIQQIISSGPQHLVHGDPHHNNIWWRLKDYDSEEEKYEYLIFDFQTIRKGPIGLDLSYFFCCCPLNYDYDELFQIFASSTTETTNKILDDTLLHFLIFVSSLIEYLANFPPQQIIPHNFLASLDIFHKFEVDTVAKSLLDDCNL